MVEKKNYDAWISSLFIFVIAILSFVFLSQEPERTFCIFSFSKCVFWCQSQENHKLVGKTSMFDVNKSFDRYFVVSKHHYLKVMRCNLILFFGHLFFARCTFIVLTQFFLLFSHSVNTCIHWCTRPTFFPFLKLYAQRFSLIYAFSHMK